MENNRPLYKPKTMPETIAKTIHIKSRKNKLIEEKDNWSNKENACKSFQSTKCFAF